MGFCARSFWHLGDMVMYREFGSFFDAHHSSFPSCCYPSFGLLRLLTICSAIDIRTLSIIYGEKRTVNAVFETHCEISTNSSSIILWMGSFAWWWSFQLQIHIVSRQFWVPTVAWFLYLLVVGENLDDDAVIKRSTPDAAVVLAVGKWGEGTHERVLFVYKRLALVSYCIDAADNKSLLIERGS